MWWLYCLPGRLLAQFSYLFPKNYIDAVQTGRQRNSGFIHFLYSTMIYALLIFIGLGSIVAKEPRTKSGVAQVAKEAAVERRGDIPEAQPQTDEADSSPPSPDDTSAQTVPEDEFRPLTPESSSQLSDAISEAMKSGQAVRWSDGDQAGYAVVSEPQDQTGCRTLYYSVDTHSPEWRSPVSTVCKPSQ